MHAAGEQKQPACHGLGLHPAGERGVGRAALGVVELGGDHGAEATHVGDRRHLASRRLEPLAQARAEAACSLDEALFGEHVEHRVRRGDGDGVTGVGAPEAAGGRGVHDVGPAADGGERKAAGEALGHDDQVGVHPRLLVREHRAGAAEAGLHLVDDEHDAVLVAAGA